MEIDKTIAAAFSDPYAFRIYYNLRKNLFTDSSITVLHEAKTISVCMECFRLHEIYGFTYRRLFEAVKETFPGRPVLMSGLVDLTDVRSFEDSIELLANEYAEVSFKLSIPVS